MYVCAWDWKVETLHLTATYLSWQISQNAFRSVHQSGWSQRSLYEKREVNCRAALHFIVGWWLVALKPHPVHSTKCNKDIKYSYEANRCIKLVHTSRSEYSHHHSHIHEHDSSDACRTLPRSISPAFTMQPCRLCPSVVKWLVLHHIKFVFIRAAPGEWACVRVGGGVSDRISYFHFCAQQIRITRGRGTRRRQDGVRWSNPQQLNVQAN